MGYVNALGDTASDLRVMQTYLAAQSATTHVFVEGERVVYGGGSGAAKYLAFGRAYWDAAPASVRAQFPLRALPAAIASLPEVAPGNRYLGTAGQIRDALARATAVAVLATPPAPPAPRASMSKAAKIGIALALLGGVYYVATRKGGSR